MNEQKSEHMQLVQRLRELSHKLHIDEGREVRRAAAVLEAYAQGLMVGLVQGSNPAEAAHKDLALLKGATRAVCSAYERAVESGWLQVHQDAHDEAMLELIRLCPPGRAGAGLVESTMPKVPK